ncbi:M23 family metallopeptidase [Alicyclobacillus shizuokensis]|uniref:M23 family metallopeptidase n=1 Tax=Alicyclobacillus shizuokensis TaxID=392014 RepID=UPI0009FA0D68|nr:M23 family metallopeptidase [Alicyclobacillus shizuokensis]MCL6625827.1 M23 family metallopeptidase [Alicyclobacillus shizuokensis]
MRLGRLYAGAACLFAVWTAAGPCSAATLRSAESASVASAPAAHSIPRQQPLRSLYEEAARWYEMPWALLAAIDRYADLTKSRTDRQEAPWYGFAFAPSAWAGIDNPDSTDVNPVTIALFRGIGVDANGDRLALQWEAKDRIFALARWLDEQSGEEDVEESVWNLFQDPVAMDRIFEFQKLFERFGLNPRGHCFPLDKRYNYTVEYSFGAGRSYGGRRMHEGVDIFAGYGTPVLACSYGYVELMGWNRFGGWRVGIRDANNMYYYYAHLSSFAKGLKRGDLVQPGQVIGYVGSSGYGPPGTSGKFPAHLHFGIYRDTGHGEWAFSPSGLLSLWQRQPQRILPPQR